MVAGRDHERFVMEGVSIHVYHIKPGVPQLMNAVGICNIANKKHGGYIVAVVVQMRKRVKGWSGLGNIANDGKLDGRGGGMMVG